MRLLRRWTGESRLEISYFCKSLFPGPGRTKANCAGIGFAQLRLLARKEALSGSALPQITDLLSEQRDSRVGVAVLLFGSSSERDVSHTRHGM
jgi:hypothetical protein